MLLLNWILFLSQEGPVGQPGLDRVVDLELRRVVFDDLFSSRKNWAAGGERNHRNMVCATLLQHGLRPARPEPAARAAKSIIPVNFPGQNLAARGGISGREPLSESLRRI